jgi:phospholipid/cholesterol/gamma-HCH transport system permease protein
VATTVSPLIQIGRSAISGAQQALAVASVIGHAVHSLTAARGRMRRVTREVLKRQILFTGVEALPFTALIALLSAAVVVVQGHLQLGSSDLLGGMLVTVVLRELGPLIVAFIVIGRSGTAIAAELASMRTRGEIDTLEAMGIDPFEYLIVPRLAGMVAAVFALTVAFVAICLLGGWGMLQLVASNPPALSAYTAMLAAPLGQGDLAVFLAKTIVPGLIVAAVACHEGLAAGASATEVPRAATRAVVRALSAVFLWDAGVTALVYLG